MNFIRSFKREQFAAMSDADVVAEYVTLYNLKRSLMDIDTTTDEQLDALEFKLFILDDELCARSLDLPC
jgi:hypothetical protein